ncbi:hypothetical protein ASPWEDRAFT_373975 [Aspergillus wentii DTO 134E9]|uniref:Uncharacterized protein n=1 Tax=Aspergillus wentii DTO 134E9 TaxID=1073089 RepID=A0A1L9RWW9_ASPWE|nr:uncharacterized protein ASPWEDRAFT_373975 [Aspergillus wentii DTO 134E9]OJJ39440.1 hypothetical protein ASPWEDRAFT_373975 [Aspergillus wentii DTO 134E9]
MGPESLCSCLNLPCCIAVSSRSVRTFRNVCRRLSNCFAQASIPSGQYSGCSRSNHHRGAWENSTGAAYANSQSITPTICRFLLTNTLEGRRLSHHILKGPWSFAEWASRPFLASLEKSCLATSLRRQSSAESTASFRWWDKCSRCNSA